MFGVKDMTQSKKYVYIVMGDDSPCYGDQTWVSGVFENQIDAENYAQDQNKLHESCGEHFWVRREEVITSYEDPKLTKYFECEMWCDEPIPDQYWDSLDDEDFQTYAPYNGDTYVVLPKEDECIISAYSVNSFKEAQELAIQAYNKLKGNKNENK